MERNEHHQPTMMMKIKTERKRKGRETEDENCVNQPQELHRWRKLWLCDEKIRLNKKQHQESEGRLTTKFDYVHNFKVNSLSDVILIIVSRSWLSVMLN